MGKDCEYRVAKREVGEKMIVCGRAARWWDQEIKDKISSRLALYKQVISGREDLWGEYCRLRKEVKDLVRIKKLNAWNEVVEKVNSDFEGGRKEFWAFVGRRTKAKSKGIAYCFLEGCRESKEDSGTLLY